MLSTGDLIQEAHGEIDFVKEINVWIPLRVIMLILGVPEQDGEMMHRLTGQLFSPHDPDTTRRTVLRSKPDLVGHAVEEILRYVSPVGHSFGLPSTIMNFAVGRSRPGSLS